jgi:uncharacterized membrane-anchored protein
VSGGIFAGGTAHVPLSRNTTTAKGRMLMRASTVAFMQNKVPEVTVTFWIIKILSTTVGETGADYLAVHVGLGMATTVGMMVAVLAALLTTQLRRREYVPWVYWSTVVLISIVGTQLTDILTDSLGVSLYVTTVAFTIALCIAFFLWHQSEGTLSIQSIVTRRREVFYWAVVLVTFALGTAAGDLATEAIGLGFGLGTIVFGGLLVMMAAAAYSGANPIGIFWLAYILTRPFGASLGDLLSQSRHYGGLGLGTVITSAIFLAVIVVLVSAHSINRARSHEAANL